MNRHTGLLALLLLVAVVWPTRGQPPGVTIPPTRPSEFTPPRFTPPADPLAVPPSAPAAVAPTAPSRSSPRPAADPLADRTPAFTSFVFFGWSVLAVMIFLVCVLLARRGDRSEGLVRIVRPPPGDAPPGIRAAWVGVVLPLAPGCPVPVSVNSFGAVNQGSEGEQVGYLVDGRAAIAALAVRNALAAAWWEEHAAHVLAPGYQFLFPTAACERVR